MFAGLLFLWRLIMSAIFASSTNMDVFYYLTIAASFSFFAIHAVIRPYRRWFYNVIDILMLGNVFIIAYISLIIYDSSFESIPRKP